MKKLATYIFIALAAFSTVSCEKWLQATSSTQFQADEILKSRDGYLDALSGVYITMGSSDAYGMYATWYMNDIICCPYQNFTSAKLMNLQNHNYTHVNVREDIATLWKGYYNIIANANMILDRLEGAKGLFSSELEFNLIKGELLAIRAYCHFDLMRTFGIWGWDSVASSKLTIPYVLHYGMQVTPQLTYKETAELLMKDLNESLRLLAKDPVTGVIPSGFNEGPNADGYWNNRRRHLNLYAVQALAARIYQWREDYDNAAMYAQLALDGITTNGGASWVDQEAILTTYDNDRKDWTFSSEHLFSLECTGLYERTMGYLIPGASTSEAFHLDETFSYIFIMPYEVDDDVEIILGDIRGEALLLKYNQGGYDCYKLYGSSSYWDKYRNLMPMIKLPELYFILADARISQNREDDARALLDEVRKHRGIQENLPSTVDVADVLAQEYEREFINEGQILYHMKHVCKNVYSGFVFSHTGRMTRVQDMTLPYPDAEINYGRKQEL